MKAENTQYVVLFWKRNGTVGTLLHDKYEDALDDYFYYRDVSHVPTKIFSSDGVPDETKGKKS